MSYPLSDGLIALCWGAVNFLLARSAWRWANRLFPDDRFAMRCLHSLVLIWGTIVLVATVLGTFGWISGLSLLGAMGLAAIALHCFLPLPPSPPRPDTPTPSDSDGKVGGIVILMLWWCFCSLALAHSILNGLLEYPSDWDTLMYHLPMVDQWIQCGSLYAPDSYWFNPGNNELIALWFAAPFSGDFLVQIANLLPGALFVFAVLALASSLGISSPLAHATAFAASAQQVWWRQLIDLENDVAVAGLFCACCAYGIRFIRDGRDRNLAFSAVTIGLLMGVKFYALGYAAVAWFALVVGAGWCRGGRTGFRCAVILLGGMCVFGGYWYARNLVVGGSPIYPKYLFSADDPLTAMYPNVRETTFIGNPNPAVGRLALEAVWRVGGPLHLAAVVASPCVLVWLSWSAIRRRKSVPEGSAASAVLVLLIAGSFAVLVRTPFAVETEPGTLESLRHGYLPFRFSLVFISASFVGLILMLEHLAINLFRWRFQSRWNQKFGIVALPLLLVAFVQMAESFLEAVRDNWFWDAPALSAVILIAAVDFRMLSGTSLGRIARCGRFLLVSGLISSALWVTFLSRSWHVGFADHYDEASRTRSFTLLERKIPSDTKLCVLDYRPYPWFGSARNFRVCEPFRLITLADLRAYCRSTGATLLVIHRSESSVRGRYQKMHDQIANNEKEFELIEEGAWFDCYRILP